MTAKILFCLTCAAFPLAPALAQPTTISGFSHPESVLIDGEARYVSNIGEKLDPVAHDGDGFISLLAADGRIERLRAITGLNAPKGMAMLEGRLYVTDIDRVLGFDASSLEQLSEARLPGDTPAMLNDIVVMGSALLVSDTLRGLVYRLSPQNGQFEPLIEGIPGPNGLIWDESSQSAHIAGLGAQFEGGDLFRWSVADGLSRIDGGPHGILDGLAQDAQGRLITSDWRSLDGAPGAVTVFDPTNGAVSDALDGAVLHGPADFAIDPADGDIWLPVTLDGQVVVLPAP